MKGLYRYLSPFSPDQSGAVAVLYELGGIIVILDAGGCAGNICGFDEPRWGHKQSAVYSAGIRDLDAILGRDERTINKVGGAVEAVGNATFIALIGTPVPAVVGTDLKALARMCETKFGLPTLAIETYGMEYYDKGAETAYMTLLRALESGQLDASFEALGLHVPSKVAASRKAAMEALGDGALPDGNVGCVGVLGATPLDLLSLDGAARIREEVARYYSHQNVFAEAAENDRNVPKGFAFDLARQQSAPDVYVFGMDSGFGDLPHLFTVDRNIVISPAGLAPARHLAAQYGIPYDVEYPLHFSFTEKLHDRLGGGKRVLILHQQVAANTLRQNLRDHANALREMDLLMGTPEEQLPAPYEISVGSFFEMDEDLMEAGDAKFPGEDAFIAYVKDGNFDVILGDPMYRMALKWWDGTFLSLPQYSVSGEAHEALREEDLLK